MHMKVNLRSNITVFLTLSDDHLHPRDHMYFLKPELIFLLHENFDYFDTKVFKKILTCSILKISMRL